MDAHSKIVKALKKATGVKKIHLETPIIESHGDYSTNIAMIVAKKEKKNPNKLAEDIKKKLSKDKVLAKYISKIEVAGPGFINFWLSKDALLETLNSVLNQKDNYGKSDYLKGRKYLLEHTSPDPIKTIHIGHLRNNFLGMSIGNAMKFLGAKVILDCVNNDRGTHVNRAMFGYLVFGRKNLRVREESEYIKAVKRYDIGDDEIKRSVEGKSWRDLVGEWMQNKKDWYVPEDFDLASDKFNNAFYSLGQRSCELVEPVDEQIQDMLIAWEDEDEYLRKLWRQIIDWSMAGYAKTYARIGSHHDKVWNESDYYDKGKEWVKKGVKKGVFKTLDDGAVLSNLADYGLTDTILIKKDKTAVYHTQDLQLTHLKSTKYLSDLYIWVIGNEQKLYLQQLFAMCEQLGIEKKENLMHLNYGFLTLKGGVKMSSRYGSVVNADDLLDDLRDRALGIIAESNQELRGDMSDEDRHELAEKVGLGAAKYGFLKYSREKDAVFDMEESLSLQGNSGPYLQYTYARTQSVLNKAKSYKTKTVNDYGEVNKEEELLLRSFVLFPGVLVDVVNNYSTNTLCNYLFDLAQKYNNFYNQHKILGSKNERLRLALTTSTGQILANGLVLLGIQAPKRM